MHATHPDQHIHTKAHSAGSGHSPVDHAYFERVSVALSTVGAVPDRRSRQREDRAREAPHEAPPAARSAHLAVQAADHPPDGELLVLGRTFFKSDDRMHAQA